MATTGFTMPGLLPRSIGDSTLRGEKGIYIMDLKGGHEEMGAQMGGLVRGIVDAIVTKYYRDLPEKLIAHSYAGHLSRVLPPRIANAIYALFRRLNGNKLGDEMSGFIRSHCEAMDIDPREGVNALLFADILHYLAGKTFASMSPPGGCSGFFARDKATKDGKVVVGRNFDFFGRGIWNEHQTITVIRPRGKQAYFWVGSLGIPFGGFGLNEAGIALLTFTKFCRDVSLRGRPLMTICLEIMESAASLDDVVDIIARENRIASLSFLMVDTKTRDARVIGFSAKHMEILNPENDYLIQTNHYMTEEMMKLEVAPSAWLRHSRARITRLEHLLQENYGAIDPALAVKFMSDPVDPFEGRKRVVGDIIASTNNAMSLVLSPDDDAIYIAHGDFPVCHSDKFLGFRISALFKGEADASSSVADLPGAGHLDDIEKAAVLHYEDAWSEYLHHNDISLAVYHLRRAAELIPDEPIFHRTAGLLLLKSGFYRDAMIHLEKNAAPDYRVAKVKAESLLWAGRCRDLLGQRDQAAEYYKQAIAIGDAEMSAAAGRGLKKPFVKSGLNNLDVELVTGSPLVKYA